MSPSSIRDNLLRIQEKIAAAAQRAGRRTEDITLIAVSKTHPGDAIVEAYEAGVRHFGENRVQEWEGKRAGTEGLVATWHLIGHLQSNKAARAARLFHSVDSVDDFALAQKLDRAREEAGIFGKLRVLIEVRIAPEDTKSGAEISSLPELAEKVAALPRLQLVGLMCIPPFFASQSAVISNEARTSSLGAGSAPRNLSVPSVLNTVGADGTYPDPIGSLPAEGTGPSQASSAPPGFVEAGLEPGSSPSHPVRPYFRRLRELRDELIARLRLDLPVLSMGMSHDFEVAIEEGATEVRVGTALFGSRL